MMARRSEVWRVTAYRADAPQFAAWTAQTRTRDAAYRLLLSCESDMAIGEMVIEGARWSRRWIRSDETRRWWCVDDVARELEPG